MTGRNLLFALSFLVIGCARKQDELPKITEDKKQLYTKAGWLIGEWENENPDGAMREIWEHSSDSVYSAKSFVLKGNDTVFSETVRLAERGNGIFYIVSVPGQNGDKPVAFQLVASTGDSLVFENKKHDFPQTITYRNFHGDSLLARISGPKNGKTVAQEFPMVKSK